MKKSAIIDIFNGQRGHFETMHMPNKNTKSLDIVCDTYDELKEKLSPEQLDLHQRLVDALEDMFDDEIDFYFAEGFKLGLLIGIESCE